MVIWRTRRNIKSPDEYVHHDIVTEDDMEVVQHNGSCPAETLSKPYEKQRPPSFIF